MFYELLIGLFYDNLFYLKKKILLPKLTVLKKCLVCVSCIFIPHNFLITLEEKNKDILQKSNYSERILALTNMFVLALQGFVNSFWISFFLGIV